MNRPQPLPPLDAEQQAVLDLLGEGGIVSALAIAGRIGCSERTIKRWCGPTGVLREHGVVPCRRKGYALAHCPPPADDSPPAWSDFDPLAPRYGTAAAELVREVRATLDDDPLLARAFEAGRLSASLGDADDDPRPAITSTNAALAFCRVAFARLAADGRQEAVYVVTLNTKHRVIGTHRVGLGVLDGCLMHPREVFRPAIRDAAAAVLLVHNHPSGDPTPSRQDERMTDRVRAAGKVVGIDLLDHIVVAAGRCVSVAAMNAAAGDRG